MGPAFVFGIVFSLSGFASAQEGCQYCIESDSRVTRSINALARLSEAQLLQRMQREKIAVLVVDAGRASPRNLFSWGKQVRANGEMAEFTARNDVLGLTLCKGEHERAKTADTVVLASDAPRITLFHQYLKLRQINRDRSWCKTKKELWARDSTMDEDRELELRKWDVLKLLWKNRARLKLGIEDEIVLAGELSETAKTIRKYDASVASFLSREKVTSYLTNRIAKHKELFANMSYTREVARFVTELSFKTRESFLNRAYCFFVFHEVIDEDRMTPKKFKEQITAASLPLAHVQAYYDWLGTVVGQKCIDKIGISFELIKEAQKGKRFALFVNEEAIRAEGRPRSRTMAHEYLHIAYLRYKNRRVRVKKEWERLSDVFKARFKKKHAGYDFQNSATLEREYFSHTYEPQLESGLRMLMENREDRLNTYQSFWKRRR